MEKSTITAKEYKELMKTPAKKKHKYAAKRKIYNGINYDSTKEANYAQYLDLLQSQGLLTYEHQVKFKLDVNGVHICDYYLDFKITWKEGPVEYVDIKGYKVGAAYQIFVYKKKLVKALYNVDIIER